MAESGQVPEAARAPTSRCGTRPPEGLDPVGVRLIPDIFTDRVVDGLVIEPLPLIGAVLVRVDLGLLGGSYGYEALKGGRVVPGDDRRADCVRGPIDGTRDHGLADASPTGPQPLPAVLVLFLATQIGLVDLQRTRHVRGFVQPSLAQSLAHEPRRLLCDVQSVSQRRFND